MKKCGTFIISAVITILILVIFSVGYDYFFGVKESYTLSSEISFFNKNGLIEGYALDYKDCKNEDGNFELKIKVGSQESRKIGFEISALLNYEQQYFYNVESQKEAISAIVFAEENSKEITITLDKQLFDKRKNQLIINIRQDMEQLSSENELVRDSNTLNFTFYVTNKEGKEQEVMREDQLIHMAEAPFEDAEQNNVIEVNPVRDKDNPLIRAKKNEDIRMNLRIGGRYTEQYILWASLDSKQVKINGNPYNNIQIEKNTVGNTTITIENKMPAGRYELEIFGVPSPYEEKSSVIKEIISAKRYTVEVE